MKYLKKMSGYLVYLSPVNPEDFEISAKWMNDREVAENLSVFHRQYSFLKENRGWQNRHSTTIPLPLCGKRMTGSSASAPFITST